MIKFEGTLCDEVKRWFIKKAKRTYAFVGTMSILVSVIATLIVLKATNANMAVAYELVFKIIITIIPIAILFGVLFFNKKNTKLFPKEICIEDKYIVCVTGFEKEKKNLKHVEEVWDYGLFYELVLSGKKTINFVCQKDLLVEGTIEEFEALFEGKIECCENGY